MAIYGVIIPILPEVAKEGSQPLLFASYACALLVMTPVFGVLSDLLGDRKGPMLVGQVGMLLATVLFILADAYWWLVVARILQGVSAAATWVVGLALLMLLVHRAECVLCAVHGTGEGKSETAGAGELE